MKSTTGRLILGVGYTITQANIRFALLRKLITPEMDPAEIAAKLVGKVVEDRHVLRTERLIYRGERKQAA